MFNNVIRASRASASESLAAFLRVHFGGLFLFALFTGMLMVLVWWYSIKLVVVPAEIIHEYR